MLANTSQWRQAYSVRKRRTRCYPHRLHLWSPRELVVWYVTCRIVVMTRANKNTIKARKSPVKIVHAWTKGSGMNFFSRPASREVR